VLNYDQWDGYPAERERIVQHLATHEVPNVVVLTGDIHLAAVGQLRAGDRATGTPVGVEFVATSISSAGLLDESALPLLQSLPALVDAELLHRGYVLHTVTPLQWSADYRMVTDALVPDSDVTSHDTYVVSVGTNTVRLAAG
jgi:alkaline phosphatase D